MFGRNFMGAGRNLWADELRRDTGNGKLVEGKTQIWYSVTTARFSRIMNGSHDLSSGIWYQVFQDPA